MIFRIVLFFSLPLSALQLSIHTGKEEGKPYSILHLRDQSPFKCQETRNDFGEAVRVECLFKTIPKEGFEPLSHPFYKIESAKTKSGYSIFITPKAKMKLMPVGFDLKKDPQTYLSDELEINHWMIIGYVKQIPLLNPVKPGTRSINFPIKMAQEVHPFVGGLDLKGNPIKMARVQDVTDYMEMKKAYAVKDYDKVLSLADSTLKDYPDSVFKNELMLYQIRALHEKENFEPLIEISKQFIRAYSADPNIGEVLAYTGNAYSKIGQYADADYFYDRLFDEQLDTPFAAQGMIFKARQLEAAGNGKRAMRFYERALATSKDVHVASDAAFRLASIELGLDDVKKASEYVEKIAKANPGYFAEVREKSKELAQRFEEQKDLSTAAKITESLLKSTPKTEDEHQVLLKDLGLQLARTNQKNEALKRLNEYLKEYKTGEFVNQVKHAKDGLFFDINETVGADGVKKYDELIEEYANDTVGHKALYKKAQLLLKLKRYQEVLDIEGELYKLDSTEYPDVNKMIGQSAIGLEKEHLKELRCAEAMALHKMYRVKLLPKWDGLTFDCALKMGQYPTAKTIAAKHLKSPDIKERQGWLLRMAKTQFALGEYPQALKSGKELSELMEVEKNPQVDEAYRIIYDTVQRTGDEEGMIRYIQEIEKTFGNDFKDIERYTQMVSLGMKRKDDAIIQKYAKKVMALQSRTKTYTQSPFVEFTLAQSLSTQGKSKEALEILKTLNGKKLDGENRSRQQYLVGSLAQKVGRNTEARAAFNASIKAAPASAWGKLAKDALGLL